MRGEADTVPFVEEFPAQRWSRSHNYILSAILQAVRGVSPSPGSRMEKVLTSALSWLPQPSEWGFARRVCVCVRVRASVSGLWQSCGSRGVLQGRGEEW